MTALNRVYEIKASKMQTVFIGGMYLMAMTVWCFDVERDFLRFSVITFIGLIGWRETIRFRRTLPIQLRLIRVVEKAVGDRPDTSNRAVSRPCNLVAHLFGIITGKQSAADAGTLGIQLEESGKTYFYTKYKVYPSRWFAILRLFDNAGHRTLILNSDCFENRAQYQSLRYELALAHAA